MNDNKDCWPCRLITGGGAIGIGVYVYVQSKKRLRLEAGVMRILSAGAVFVGVLRLLDANFLKVNKSTK